MIYAIIVWTNPDNILNVYDRCGQDEIMLLLSSFSGRLLNYGMAEMHGDRTVALGCILVARFSGNRDLVNSCITDEILVELIRKRRLKE